MRRQTTKSPRMTEQTKERAAVLYNAQCPVCRVEIEHYADYSQKHDLPIRFDDLNATDALARWGIDADTAARRLHVLKDGDVLTGIPAFIVLWEEMPRYRRLAKVVSTPVVFQLACFAYEYVLAPLIYRYHLRRLRRRMATR